MEIQEDDETSMSPILQFQLGFLQLRRPLSILQYFVYFKHSWWFLHLHFGVELHTIHDLLHVRERKKLHEVRLKLYDGWHTSFILLLTIQVVTNTDLWHQSSTALVSSSSSSQSGKKSLDKCAVTGSQCFKGNLGFLECSSLLIGHNWFTVVSFSQLIGHTSYSTV